MENYTFISLKFDLIEMSRKKNISTNFRRSFLCSIQCFAEYVRGDRMLKIDWINYRNLQVIGYLTKCI